MSKSPNRGRGRARARLEDGSPPEAAEPPQLVFSSHTEGAEGNGSAPVTSGAHAEGEAVPAPRKPARAAAERKPTSDPIYRIMHRLPRSDVLEVVKCKFGKEHCERAASYFDAAFMQNPLRRVKLQIGCSGPGGTHLFFPRLFFHRFSLRTLDLSRNHLSAEDLVTLCEGLALGPRASGASASSPVSQPSSAPAAHTSSCLELLDLSYSLGIGNAGAVYLLSALRHNTTIRAVQLVSVGVDDDGAAQLAPLLRSRPRPAALADGSAATVGYMQGFSAVTEQRPYTFFLNLNHNVIGTAGTEVLGKGLPSYVSLTLAKQRLKGSDNPAARKWHNGRRARRRGRMEK